MPNSMTGFARCETKESWGTITCELKSVNHRFLDLYFRLPETLRELEIEFRQNMKNALARGKVECNFQLQLNDAQTSRLVLDTNAAEHVLVACGKIAAASHNVAVSPINPMDVLHYPGVLSNNTPESENIHNAAHKTLAATLSSLNDIRRREGDDMAAVIGHRVDAMYEQLDIVKAAFPAIKAGLEARLRDRLAALSIETNPDRVEQELVFLAQKMDIDEELDRLATHLSEIRRVLAADEPIGRRLDFLMQELNREANTLASKSQGIASTNVSIEMKVLIEQMREQIQNIE